MDARQSRRVAAVRKALSGAVLSHPPTDRELNRLALQIAETAGLSAAFGEVARLQARVDMLERRLVRLVRAVRSHRDALSQVGVSWDTVVADERLWSEVEQEDG